MTNRPLSFRCVINEKPTTARYLVAKTPWDAAIKYLGKRLVSITSADPIYRHSICPEKCSYPATVKGKNGKPQTVTITVALHKPRYIYSPSPPPPPARRLGPLELAALCATCRCWLMEGSGTTSLALAAVLGRTMPSPPNREYCLVILKRLAYYRLLEMRSERFDGRIMRTFSPSFAPEGAHVLPPWR